MHFCQQGQCVQPSQFLLQIPGRFHLQGVISYNNAKDSGIIHLLIIQFLKTHGH